MNLWRNECGEKGREREREREEKKKNIPLWFCDLVREIVTQACTFCREHFESARAKICRLHMHRQ